MSFDSVCVSEVVPVAAISAALSREVETADACNGIFKVDIIFEIISVLNFRGKPSESYIAKVGCAGSVKVDFQYFFRFFVGKGNARKKNTTAENH